MMLDKEFFFNLNTLEKYKTKPELNDFFNAVDKLEKLGKEINDEKNKKSSDTSKLDKQAQDLTRKLEEEKQRHRSKETDLARQRSRLQFLRPVRRRPRPPFATRASGLITFPSAGPACRSPRATPRLPAPARPRRATRA